MPATVTRPGFWVNPALDKLIGESKDFRGLPNYRPGQLTPEVRAGDYRPDVGIPTVQSDPNKAASDVDWINKMLDALTREGKPPIKADGP